MIRTSVRLPTGRDEVEAGEGVGLSNQIVAAMAVLDDALRGAGIAGIDDDASRRFDPIPESLLPFAVLHQERFHGDIAVLIDVAGFDLMHVHLVAGCIRALKAGATDRDVFPVGGENVFDHGACPFRTPKLKWFCAAHRPGCQNEIRQAEGVVGMEMCKEADAQCPRFQTRDALLPCRCGGPAYDACAGVEHIGMAAHHNSDARSRALWVGQRCSGTQHNDLNGGCLGYGNLTRHSYLQSACHERNRETCHCRLRSAQDCSLVSALPQMLAYIPHSEMLQRTLP